MKIHKLPIILAITALVISTLACGGNFSTGNIGDAWLSNDGEGSNRTTIFSLEDTKNLFVELNIAPDDTELKVTWNAVDAEGVDPNHLHNEINFTFSDVVVHFDLSNDSLWPFGSYKADVYLYGTVDWSLSFEAQ
jgi:hypothetical protein